MAEAVIYPGTDKANLKSLKEMLEKRGIAYSVAGTGDCGGYTSMVGIDGEFYRNSPTLLRHLDSH